EREEVLDQQEKLLPPLRHKTAQARSHEEVVQAAYKEAQEETRAAHAEELDVACRLDQELLILDRELIKTRPAIIDEFIREWEDEFAKLGNQILPTTYNRPVPGQYRTNPVTGSTDPVLELVSNADSIAASSRTG